MREMETVNLAWIYLLKYELQESQLSACLRIICSIVNGGTENVPVFVQVINQT